MAAFQNFRSAVGGFNREDVVHYIEFINNKHASQVNQLNTEIQTLRQELEQLRGVNVQGLTEEIDLLKAKNAQLQEELEQAQEQSRKNAQQFQTDMELEAYRRAERAERSARARVAQLYHQANGVVADATVRVDEAAVQICDLADQVSAKLQQLQSVVSAGKNTLHDVAAAMYAISPVQPEE